MKGILDSLGIRFRLILALGTAAGLVALGLVAVELALVPSIVRLHADRLVVAGKIAVAGAPEDPAGRARWAARLSNTLPGMNASLFPFQPGAPGFVDACREHRVKPDRVIAAYTEGESVATSFGDGIDYLIRV